MVLALFHPAKHKMEENVTDKTFSKKKAPENYMCLSIQV